MAVARSEEMERFERTWSRPHGFLGRLAVVNFAPVGIRFMVTALVFFLIAGVMALLMRVQLIRPDNDFLGPQAYNQFFTMHGSTMMYLFLVPFLEGLAIYLTPLMIGARDMAFPRLTAFGYWSYLFGGVIFYLSFLVGAIPDAGWFAYTPLSTGKFSGLGMDFWLLGLGLVEIGGITAGVELIVTILKLRAPGMAINRMPLLVWAVLVTGFMIVFAFTTLLTATVLLELDRSIGTCFFIPEEGGSSLLWQHLFWFFGHPEVYIAFIPATGVVSMVVPVFSRRPIAAYVLIVVAIMIIGFVSFGLWVHHMYTTGLPNLSMSFFAAASLMIALASGTQIFAWIATMWGSRPLFRVPLMYVLGFIFIFVLGGLTGVMVAIVPFDWQVHDTYFVVAHFHYVLIGGVVFPIFAGIHYWFPKVTGRMMNGLAGHIAFWLAFVGFNLTFFPMHIMGFLGMPRRVYTYTEELEVGAYNVAATIGGFMFALGVVIEVGNGLLSLWRGPRAGKNPWGADSLEWSVESPVPSYGFAIPPRVRGLHHLWVEQGVAGVGAVGAGESAPEPEASVRARSALDRAPLDWRATLVTDAVTAEPAAIHRLPGPTHTPLIAALGLLVASLAMIMSFYILAIFGLLVAVATGIGWLWPKGDVVRTLRKSRVGEAAGVPIFSTGWHAAPWWGLLGFMACAGTVVVVLMYSYFYIRLYSEAWPQGGIGLPGLVWRGSALGLLVVGAGAQVWARRNWVRTGRTTPAHLALALGAALAVGCVVLHAYDLGRAECRPWTNAYASLVYVMSAAMWLLAGIAVLVSLAVHGSLQRDRGHDRGFAPLHLQINSHLWIFTAIAGVAVYGTLYLSPHVL